MTDDELDASVGRSDDVRRAFDDFPVMMAVLRGADHRFVACNARYRDLVGRQAFIGRPLTEVMPEVVAQQLLGWINRAYASGENQSFDEIRVQLRPDADDVRNVFLDCLLFPRRDEAGRVIGVSAMVQDVTSRVLERRAAQAAARAAEQRYEQVRDVVLVLQRQLLPAGLPILPRLRLAASYLLADSNSAAGGDWFDSVPMPDGRTALAIGDVVGHGVAASATMGQLRAVVRDRLEDTGDISAALSAGERLARRLPAARAATMCIVALEASTGGMEYCTAGHPPPLLIPADGTPRYLPGSGASPLGSGSAFPLATDRLAPEDVLLLYTDGIIERPGRSVMAGTAELAVVAHDAVADRVVLGSGLSAIERACTQTLELLVRETGHSDDITLMAVQRVPAPDGLSLRMPADAAAPRRARHELATWLRALGAGGDDVVAARHVVSELVSNAVDHAYAGSAGVGDVEVTAALSAAGTAAVVVSDHGTWAATSTGRDRGRGLLLASSLADGMDIARGDGGTRVTVLHQLTHAARLLSPEDVRHGVVAPPAPPQTEILLVLDADERDGRKIRVDGPIDQDTADTLRREIRVRLTGQPGPLVVDLNGVTHLGSAGVAAVQEVQRLAGRIGRTIVWYAEPGTVAQQVLSVVAFPYTSAPLAMDLPADLS